MLSKPFYVLGLETSCDETAVALMSRAPDGRGEVLSQRVFSQVELHRAFGGVVPEIASRSHSDKLFPLVQDVINEAGLPLAHLDAIAATAGPGLIGGLLVGVMLGKGVAFALEKPFFAVNHLEGHALTPRLTSALSFPYLLFLISGGHTQVLAVLGVGNYQFYGGTLDDALGEAFDKTAKMLGLGYPGGVEVEKQAQGGDPTRFSFPLPLSGRVGCDFSFSGLKTAVRQVVEREKQSTHGVLSATFVADVCASFQDTVGRLLKERLSFALGRFYQEHWQEGLAKPTLVASGGVASNQRLRAVFQEITHESGYNFVVPPPSLCTDNAVMIAWAALERIAQGERGGDPLSFKPRPRWPLFMPDFAKR